MSTVGEQLRAAREAKSLTVHQVAEITKIRTDHIRALEEGNFNVFSATVYIRGFVRTYATLLKLGVPGIMAALDKELGQTDNFSAPPPLSNEPRNVLDFLMLQFSKVNWSKGLIALGIAIVLVSAVVISLVRRHYQTADPLVGLPPGLYQSTQSISGEVLPLPPLPPRR
jgi:cytoskeletal protein RodZ